MREKSSYEGTLDRTGQVYIGTVIGVDPAARTLHVKTSDLDLYDVKALQDDWSLEGDESGGTPRKGSYGLVIFSETEVYWLGCAAPVTSAGTGKRENQADLNEGDKVYGTVAGNRIIVRTGGTIEIQASPLNSQCKTLWSPREDRMSSACQNSELTTASGYLNWLIDKNTDESTLDLKAWNSRVPDNAVQIRIGTVPEDVATEEGSGDKENSEESSVPAPTNSELVLDITQGAVADDLSFTQKTFRAAIKTDGSFYLDAGPDKFSILIDAATGNLKLETKGSLSGVVKQNVSIAANGTVDVSTDGGAVTVKSSGDAEMKLDSGKVALGAPAGELLDLLHQLITALGTQTVLTPIGPAAPISGSPQWSQVMQLLQKLKGITGAL